MAPAILSPLRSIDHCVLPVRDLAVARRRYEALGFTVAPEGVHPFGTRNACVHFADGSFLEPLAIADRRLADKALAAGNVFIARDRAWRSLNANSEGVSALVLRTENARNDHIAFEAAGLSAGPMLEFARSAIDLEGRQAEAKFLLAFGAPQDEQASYFFTCQRLGVPGIDLGGLTRHPNGVQGISRVMLSSSRPGEMRGLFGRLVEPGLVEVTDLMAAGAPAAEPQAKVVLRYHAVHLRVRNIASVEALLAADGIGYSHTANGLRVAPAAGQGLHLVFEQS